MIESLHLVSKPLSDIQRRRILRTEPEKLFTIILDFIRQGHDVSDLVENIPRLYDQLEESARQWIQTQMGLIYVVRNPFLPGMVKVGLTRQSIDQRLRSLSTEGLPGNFEVINTWNTLSVFDVESAIHRELESIHVGKEFFKDDLDLVFKVIESNVVKERQVLTRKLMFLVSIQDFLGV